MLCLCPILTALRALMGVACLCSVLTLFIALGECTCQDANQTPGERKSRTQCPQCFGGLCTVGSIARKCINKLVFKCSEENVTGACHSLPRCSGVLSRTKLCCHHCKPIGFLGPFTHQAKYLIVQSFRKIIAHLSSTGTQLCKHN